MRPALTAQMKMPQFIPMRSALAVKACNVRGVVNAVLSNGNLPSAKTVTVAKSNVPHDTVHDDLDRRHVRHELPEDRHDPPDDKGSCGVDHAVIVGSLVGQLAWWS